MGISRCLGKQGSNKEMMDIHMGSGFATKCIYGNGKDFE